MCDRERASETETETKAEEGSLMMMVFAMLNPVEAECEQREGREESREDLFEP